MKKLLLTFALASIFVFDTFSQAPQWRLSMGLSPISRSDKNRVLENPYNTQGWEWMNRGGIMVSEGTVLGLMGMLRSQKVQERVSYSDNGMTSDYKFETDNMLWGTGPYVTKYFSLGERFELQATAFGLFEQGKGDFTTDLESLYCVNCEYTSNFIVFPGAYGEIERLEYKERNLYAGLELGLNYFIADRIAIQGNLTLFQYENYDNKIVGGEKMENPIPVERNIEESGSDFIFFTDRPVFHVGLMLVFN